MVEGSWNLGGTTPQDQVNECSVAEIGKGKLILNMRNYDRTQMNRKISISNDYGESWGEYMMIKPCRTYMSGKHSKVFIQRLWEK